MTKRGPVFDIILLNNMWHLDNTTQFSCSPNVSYYIKNGGTTAVLMLLARSKVCKDMTERVRSTQLPTLCMHERLTGLSRFKSCRILVRARQGSLQRFHQKCNCSDVIILLPHSNTPITNEVKRVLCRAHSDVIRSTTLRRVHISSTVT
jgi:hypothetical protein